MQLGDSIDFVVLNLSGRSIQVIECKVSENG